MGSLSPVHWLIVAVVILLLFGPSRLAGVGKGLGEGLRSFKKGISEDGAEAQGEAKNGDPKSKREAEKRSEDDGSHDAPAASSGTAASGTSKL